ncbi:MULTISPECIES: PstC family ABC transporter permease [Thermotoga]|uniref:Binding-protein-dependent transport systems inner membrane component n=1 Tax=Thermotoga neapolitana (strain ATCC 49049 / DSM 4359 / NBRC 107923 / NS-E) TaxID=309803 RepID=B9K953_THENN|nr:MULTISPECIES: PstC family ABC transporter permease [Thermotoga]MDK2786182.1 phosphate transport system permease protein [Thermotoga sp.]ACB09893.1 binding-protein-dependent transport systems inner membrane component [Thermotoga sp. RQ2]ACM23486.1 Binding-protein-dependent transport systems inner membrane component precursor [Thermotoga neapolitana DSM 4359]KFZ21119.1 Binding-protein-dependent transport systems inner membrane component precursor [Thermotoga neapolitana LA10]MDK2950158.1 phos
MIFVFSIIGILALFLLVFFLVKEAWPALVKVGGELFTSVYWYPTADPPEYGMLAMIAGTLLLTAFSSAILLPLGYLVAFFLHTYARDLEKSLVRTTVEFLAGTPSVIIGLFVLFYIAPILLHFDIWSTENFLLASIGLVLTALPYTVSLSLEALDSVDIALEESALALGATRFTTTLRVTTRAALPGILNAFVLTVNRVVGETMIVLMVGGGAAIIPRSLFDPVKPLTAAIASEIGEVAVGSMHYHVLFAAGFILLVLSLVLTGLSRYISRRQTG